MIGSYGDLNNKEQVVALIDEVRNSPVGMRYLDNVLSAFFNVINTWTACVIWFVTI